MMHRGRDRRGQGGRLAAGVPRDAARAARAADNEHTDVEVERLARATDGWAVLANTYADVVSNGARPEVKVTLGRKLARIYETELNDVSRAEESYRFVLGVNNTDNETLEALDRIYLEHGAHESLAEVLRLRVKSAQSSYDRSS